MNDKSIIQGEKAAKEGIIHLIVLGTIKLIAGFATGLSVLIVDAISTFTDTAGVIAAYFGLKISRRNADDSFEYGYYKIETVAALFISMGIIYVGYAIFSDAAYSLGSFKSAENIWIAIIITIIAIFHSYKLYHLLMDAGVQANSLALVASAKDKRNDIIASTAVLFSVFANYYQIPHVEQLVSMGIAVFIIKVGISTGKESLFFLLDYWDNPLLIKKIKKVFHSEKDLIHKVRNIRLRRAGTYIFGQAFVEINPYAGIQDLREELEILQRKVQDLNPYIKDFTIYSHIPQYKKIRVAVPIKSGIDLDAPVANTLKETNAYLIANIEDNKVKDFSIKHLSKDQKKPAQLDNFIKKEMPDILIDNNLHSLVYYNLRRTHHILIYPNFSDIIYAKQTLSLLLIDT